MFCHLQYLRLMAGGSSRKSNITERTAAERDTKSIFLLKIIPIFKAPRITKIQLKPIIRGTPATLKPRTSPYE